MPRLRQHHLTCALAYRCFWKKRTLLDVDKPWKVGVLRPPSFTPCCHQSVLHVSFCDMCICTCLFCNFHEMLVSSRGSFLLYNSCLLVQGFAFARASNLKSFTIVWRFLSSTCSKDESQWTPTPLELRLCGVRQSRQFGKQTPQKCMSDHSRPQQTGN